MDGGDTVDENLCVVDLVGACCFLPAGGEEGEGEPWTSDAAIAAVFVTESPRCCNHQQNIFQRNLPERRWRFQPDVGSSGQKKVYIPVC